MRNRYFLGVEYSKDRTTKEFFIVDRETGWSIGTYPGTRKGRLQAMCELDRLNDESWFGWTFLTYVLVVFLIVAYFINC